MTQTKHLKFTAACVALFTLQGCIAAAFPIAAGGLLARGEVGPDEPQTGAQDDGAETSSQPVVVAENSVDAAPDPNTEATGSASDTATIAVRNAAERSDDPPQDTGPEINHTTSQNAQQLAQGEREAPPTSDNAQTAVVEPVPEAGSGEEDGSTAEVQLAQTGAETGTLFDALYQYTSSGAYQDGDDRRSAILANPAALDGQRDACAPGAPATLLIDLDPGSDALLPVDAGSASPALAEKLVQLRNQGMAIAWVSRTAASDVSLLRAALFRSGLDQLGNDRLLLIGSPDQRKQTLRDQLAEIACIVAIAGDERADFHELFDYLLNPQDAALLEGLFGNGWFVIPTPFIPERSGQ